MFVIGQAVGTSRFEAAQLEFTIELCGKKA